MTIEESIKKDPSKFQAIIDTKEAAVKNSDMFLIESVRNKQSNPIR